MFTFRSFIAAVFTLAVLAQGVTAQESVAGVSNALYNLGVMAAKEKNPEVKKQLLQQVKLLQEKQSRLIAAGESPAVNSEAAVGPAAAQPPAAAQATNWSQGSYRGYQPPARVQQAHVGSYSVVSGGRTGGGSYPGYTQPLRVSQPRWGSYPIGPGIPVSGLGFGLGLQPPNPFTIGGYRYWKGPRFTWGSYPIRFK